MGALVLPPVAQATDPLDNRGYIGAGREPLLLKPGEFIARAFTLKEDKTLLAEDVRVTDASLAELRASGKYFEIRKPGEKTPLRRIPC